MSDKMWHANIAIIQKELSVASFAISSKLQLQLRRSVQLKIFHPSGIHLCAVGFSFRFLLV